MLGRRGFVAAAPRKFAHQNFHLAVQTGDSRKISPSKKTRYTVSTLITDDGNVFPVVVTGSGKGFQTGLIGTEFMVSTSSANDRGTVLLWL